MRNRILGAIAILWGGGILLSKLLGGSQVEGNGAYAAGQTVALIFGGLMFIVGVYLLIKGSNKAGP